jgi:hypothetical protein
LEFRLRRLRNIRGGANKNVGPLNVPSVGKCRADHRGVMEFSASLHEGEPFEFCLDTDSTCGWKWETQFFSQRHGASS